MNRRELLKAAVCAVNGLCLPTIGLSQELMTLPIKAVPLFDMATDLLWTVPPEQVRRVLYLIARGIGTRYRNHRIAGFHCTSNMVREYIWTLKFEALRGDEGDYKPLCRYLDNLLGGAL